MCNSVCDMVLVHYIFFPFFGLFWLDLGWFVCLSQQLISIKISWAALNYLFVADYNVNIKWAIMLCSVSISWIWLEGKLIISISGTVRLKHSYFKHAILFLLFFFFKFCRHSSTYLHFYATNHRDTGITLHHELCSWVPAQSSTFALVNRQ